jgi:transmembrane sensor
MAQHRIFNDPLMKSTHQQAAQWFVRVNSSTLSAEERQAFDRWLNADQHNRNEYQAVKALWRELDGLSGPVLSTGTDHLSRKPRKRVRRSLAVAASMVVILVAVLMILPRNPGSYETAKGFQRDLRLADETVVRLNSDSLLQVEMTNDRRILHLHRGEAYFDVTHETDRAFIVNAAGGFIRVLGTQFNVYRETSRVEVAVVEGSVEITTQSGDTRRLSAGQKVAYLIDGSSFSSVERQNNHDLDWLEGRIHFEATPLIDVVTQLNRYLEIPLYIAEPGLNKLKLSGSFRITNLKSLPELLPRLLPVSLEDAGDRVLLRSLD